MKSRLTYPLLLFVGCALLLALFKISFLALYLPLGEYRLGDWWQVLCHGFTLDMTVAGYITAIPLLVLLLSVWIPLSERFWRRLLGLVGGVMALVAAVVYAVDLGLYGYWGFRIDSSLMLYLQSPKEAMASLTLKDWLMGFGAGLLFGGVLLTALGLLLRPLKISILNLRQRLIVTPLLLLMGGLCFLAIRGGVTVAVANVSKVCFSSDQRLNHAAINPLFSLLSTLGDDKDMEPQYLFFEEEERARRFEELRGDRCDTIISPPRLLRTTRPNVVIILLESFSRNFMEARVGGREVMPSLNRLKNEGLWFENCIANSYRTDRGQVAVLNGYPAQTRISIMKYPAKSRTLPAIARTLSGVGYTTWFTYGGDLNFTDQASCMYATGWQRLTWQKELHFDAPTSKWGYADDVMADYFTDEVLRLDAASRQQGTPYLAGWLTLSSHEPFEVPYSAFESKLFNSMAFTDCQVGRVVERLKQSEAWDNLLLILVADHGYPYPSGISYNSLPRHRIPMLWLGGTLKEPAVVESYCSQSDLAATLLVQLDLPHDDFTFSRDIFSPSTPKFGYWCFNDGFGVVDERGCVIYDCAADTLVEGSDTTLLNRGKTLLQTTYKDIRER